MTPLRQRMLEDMAIRNLAENTQSAYIQQVIAYARYFHRAPEELGPEEIRAYQIHLTQASSVSVAVGALRFLYKVTLKRPWGIAEIHHMALSAMSCHLRILSIAAVRGLQHAC